MSRPPSPAASHWGALLWLFRAFGALGYLSISIPLLPISLTACSSSLPQTPTYWCSSEIYSLFWDQSSHSGWLISSPWGATTIAQLREHHSHGGHCEGQSLHLRYAHRAIWLPCSKHTIWYTTEQRVILSLDCEALESWINLLIMVELPGTQSMILRVCWMDESTT